MALEATTLSYIAAGAQALSAVQALQQGRYQAAQYELQGKMAQAKAERDAVNAEIQANDVLRKLRQTNAAAIARGFAGGVSGFSGSAKLVQEVNEKFAGRDFKNLQIAAKEKRSFGEIQKQMFEEAADAAISGSRFSALTKLATAAVTYGKTMPGGGAADTSSAVPGFEGYSSQVGMDYNIGPDFTPIKNFGGYGGY